LKKLFLIPAYYKCDNSFNPTAARNYLYDPNEFIKQASKCVQLSLAQKYEADEGSCIKFSSFNTVHKKLLENLLNRPEVSFLRFK